jgi:hypothetical protein
MAANVAYRAVQGDPRFIPLQTGGLSPGAVAATKITDESSCATMDRIFLAMIACGVLVLLGAAGMYVTKTADLMHHARTVGVAGRNR